MINQRQNTRSVRAKFHTSKLFHFSWPQRACRELAHYSLTNRSPIRWLMTKLPEKKRYMYVPCRGNWVFNFRIIVFHLYRWMCSLYQKDLFELSQKQSFKYPLFLNNNNHKWNIPYIEWNRVQFYLLASFIFRSELTIHAWLL